MVCYWVSERAETRAAFTAVGASSQSKASKRSKTTTIRDGHLPHGGFDSNEGSLGTFIMPSGGAAAVFFFFASQAVFPDQILIVALVQDFDIHLRIEFTQ